MSANHPPIVGHRNLQINLVCYLRIQIKQHVLIRLSALDLWALNIISIHKIEQSTLSFQSLIQLVRTTLDTTYYAF